MPFKRFVETGRVAWISGGRYCGRLCSIVDVIDQTRVLVDGPKTGVPRIAVRLNQIRLTKYVVKFPFKGSTKEVRHAWEKSEMMKQWKTGQWSGNLVKRKMRRRLSDFDRFKLRNARKARNTIRTTEYCRLLKQARRKKEKLRKARATWRINKKLGKPNPDKPTVRTVVSVKTKKHNRPKPKSLKKPVKPKTPKVESGKTKTVKDAGKQKTGKTTSTKPQTQKPKVEKTKAAAKPQKK